MTPAALRRDSALALLAVLSRARQEHLPAWISLPGGGAVLASLSGTLPLGGDAARVVACALAAAEARRAVVTVGGRA